MIKFYPHVSRIDNHKALISAPASAMFVGKHHCFQKTNFADDQNDPVSMVTRQIKDEFSYLFIYLIIVDIYPVTNC